MEILLAKNTNMKKILFKEEQKFGSRSLYFSMGVIYTIPTVIFSVAFYYQFILKQPWGDKPMSDLGLLVTALLIFAVLIISAFLLFNSKLSVVVTSEDIHFTFWPYISKPVIYSKSDIEKYEIRKYKPIKEYGGWGMKQGKNAVGKAYNVRGNIGLQLYFKDGKKVLIGTQRGDAFLRGMNKLMEKSK